MTQSFDHHSLSIEAGFRATPQLLFEAFTDARFIQSYTQAPATVDKKEGGIFSFFDGQIQGKIETIKEPNLLVWKWRQKEWVDDVYSTVRLEFSAPDNTTCKLKLTQTDIPDADKFHNRDVADKILIGWQKFFIERIQKMMGYTKVDV